MNIKAINMKREEGKKVFDCWFGVLNVITIFPLF